MQKRLYAAPAYAVLENNAVRSMVYFVGSWCRFAKGRVRKSGHMVRCFPLPLRGALGCRKGVVRCKDAERSSLFDRTEHFPPRTHRAHCAAIAGREAQWDKSAAVHLRTSEQSMHSRKTRSAPHISSALHQRKCGRQRTMCHLCTNLHA